MFSKSRSAAKSMSSFTSFVLLNKLMSSDAVEMTLALQWSAEYMRDMSKMIIIFRFIFLVRREERERKKKQAPKKEEFNQSERKGKKKDRKRSFFLCVNSE